MINRFYFVPGFIVSILMGFSPSFRLSSCILKILGNDVDLSATIHNKVRVLIPKNIRIGKNSTINSGCLLDSRMGIDIDENTMVGSGVKIFTLGHDPDDSRFSSRGGRVKIGKNVVIFPDCLIMPGVYIGDNAVIYPGSVVVKNVEDNSVVGGNPAKMLRDRVIDIEYRLNYRMYFSV